MKKIRTVIAISPGEVLKEELDARDWTQDDFTQITGISSQALSEIVTGKAAIYPETAIILAQALGTSPQMWLNLEASYRLDKLEQSKKADDLAGSKSIESD